MPEGNPFEARASLPAGARCAHHPDREAQRTCVRCGKYMCAECISANSAGTCLTCASRLGTSEAFPYSRDHYSFDGLLNLALSRWKKNWLPLALAQAAALLVTYFPAMLLGFFTALIGDKARALTSNVSLLGIGSQAFAMVMQAGSQLVLFGYCLDLLENKPVGFARAFERVRALPAMLLQMLIVYGTFALCGALGYALYRFVEHLASLQAGILAVALFALALVPFIVHASIGIAFTALELAHNPQATTISALTTSWQLVQDRRWSVAGTLFASGLIGGLGMLACCIGVLASAPLGTLVYSGLFLALRQPTESSAQAHSPEWPV
jgi:hypothetical protein